MIELKNVSKHYGLTKALDDVSFSVKKGEIIGFVGPNGAGKSTAMKLITTYTAPTKGKVSVGDFDVLENPLEVQKLIGYLPETVPLYADMLVREYLEFIGAARHLNGNFKQRYDWVVEAAGLKNVLHRKISVLSKGYKQRTCLAQALIHDPEVLILDEPTSGLDPIQIIGIRNLIKDLAHSKTIILSTHILPEVATIADRILVINEGRIVGDGSFEELRQKVTQRNSYYISVKSSKKDFQSAIKSISEIEDVEYDNDVPRGIVGCHVFASHKVDLIVKLNDLIRDQKWNVVEFLREKISLEDSFIKLTQSNEDSTATKEGGDE
ncbi:ATP-binding cassette domain-containing protein [candidate division KSB1 bacterium]|nr:ATP-binding cassette domain-containing protein [candidate division KSB1 bacterium]MBL7095465.1 ATP-binding cassette domain-containing protein [candidate division KSB1 bacterium]